MISQVYTLYSFNEFGDVQNPIWHVEWPIKFATIEDLTFEKIIAQEGSLLIPAETLTSDLISILTGLEPLAKQKVILQLGVTSLAQAEKFADAGLAVQVWVDRNLDKTHLDLWKTLKNKVECLIVPFDRTQIEKNVDILTSVGITHFLYLVVQKKNPYSGILDIHAQFALYQKLKLKPQVRSVRYGVELSSIKTATKGLGSFLISPTYEHYLAHLQEDSRLRHILQTIASTLNQLGLGFVVALIVFIMDALREPLVAAQRIRGQTLKLWSYTHKLRGVPPKIAGSLLWLQGQCRWILGQYRWLLGYTVTLFWKIHARFHLLFKFYWFLKFQFEKRVLKKWSS